MRKKYGLTGVAGGLLVLLSLVASSPASALADPAVPTPAAGEAPARDSPTETSSQVDAHDEDAPDVDVVEESADSGARRVVEEDFTDVDIRSRADIVVHKVTIALVAPQGTTPSFSADEARRSLDLVDRFYNRETGGAIRFELEALIDWQMIDEPIGCTNTGGLHDWIIRKTGWQPGPARHLVAMVPPGDPCPNWANGEQPGDPDDGGRTFQGGPDAILLTHELGHNLSLPHAVSMQCATTWDYKPGENCHREEYGNLTDLMGDSWTFTPLAAPTLAQLGILSNTRQPVCGAPRTTVIDSLGAGPGTPRVLTWTDPQQSSVRYWAQYNDSADPQSDNGEYTSPWETPRTVSGVQILRTNGGQIGGDLLQRPGDGSVGNEFAAEGETVALNSGMLIRVDDIDKVTHKATVTVTVPCTNYVGDIAHLATPSASYTSDWTPVGAAIDKYTGSAWSSWPRVGEQWLQLQWPTSVTIDSASVLFAADAADGDQQGTIPARSWRVEYLDDATELWTPVDNPTPAVPGRERDVANTSGFSPVTTSAVRVVFDAWGSWEHGGSTAVAELSINGIASAASLASFGESKVIPPSAVADLEQGVTVLDATQGALAGRTVVFELTGAAAFADGTTTATVVSDSSGVASLPPVVAGSAPGMLSTTASTVGVPAIALPQVSVASPIPSSPPPTSPGETIDVPRNTSAEGSTNSQQVLANTGASTVAGSVLAGLVGLVAGGLILTLRRKGWRWPLDR